MRQVFPTNFMTIVENIFSNSRFANIAKKNQSFCIGIFGGERKNYDLTMLRYRKIFESESNNDFFF